MAYNENKKKYNFVTGDSENYRKGYDRIFGKKPQITQIKNKLNCRGRDDGTLSAMLWRKAVGDGNLNMTQEQWDKETRTQEQQDEFQKWAIELVKKARVFKRMRKVRDAVGNWILEYYPKVYPQITQINKDGRGLIKTSKTERSR